MVSGGMACIKYLMFFFNFLFAISGIAFISVGAVILVVYRDYNNFVDSWFFAAPVLMIIVGVIVFLVSFFGCCGAVKEHYCMLITFSVSLLVIFALELGASISGYTMRSEVNTMLQSHLNETFYQYSTHENIRRSWDIMQYDLNCCGINTPADWRSLDYANNVVPDSCCTEIPAGEKCDSNSIYISADGCMSKLRSAIENNALTLASVIIGIGFIQLIGVTFACCLAHSIRREYETV